MLVFYKDDGPSWSETRRRAFVNEIITRVHLVGFNCNKCITMHGINNVQNNTHVF